MAPVYRDIFLLSVCIGFVLCSDVAKNVPDDKESTTPGGDVGDRKGDYTELSSFIPTTSSTLTPATIIVSTTIASTTTTAGTSESASSSATPQVSALARANTTPSSSAATKSIATGASTTGTTTKPSAKRQISLNEFQQLVAKVNDEIGMLRNQSANLSQTYDELVQRYNERTSQIPIVLYDVTNCTNASTTEEKHHSTAPSAGEGSKRLDEEGTTNGTALEVSVDADGTTTLQSTSTASATATFSTTEIVPRVSPENVPSLGEAAQSVLAPNGVPQNPSNAQTQIYGNKYYNYVHYFMYPPSDDQLIRSPNTHFHRKGGHFSQKAAGIRHRHPGHGLEQGEFDSLEEETAGNGEVAVDNRWRFPPSYRSRPWNDRERPQLVPNNLKPGPLDAQAPASFPYEIPYRRRINSNPRPPFDDEPVRPTPAYQDQLRLGGLSKPNSAGRFYPQAPAKPPKPAIDVPAPGAPSSDRLQSFLEQRRKGNVPGKLPVTPWRSTQTTERSTTPLSLDSLISGGLKPVSFSIPTTVKPVPGVARNGWDGYDFSFVRKVFGKQKRGQEEQRTARLAGRDL